VFGYRCCADCQGLGCRQRITLGVELPRLAAHLSHYGRDIAFNMVFHGISLTAKRAGTGRPGRTNATNDTQGGQHR